MILYLDSINSRNNIHYLDEPINGKYKLISFCFTNNIFNINDTNNKIYFNENGNNLIATLTNGYYDLNDLKTNISDNMNNVMSGALTITLDSNTNKFTFSVGTGNTLYFSFGTNTTNSAKKLLGFNEVDGISSNTQISDNSIDLNTIKNMFINILENNKKNIYGNKYFNTSIVINSIGGFGEMIRYNNNNNNFIQIIEIKNKKELKITFHDKNNNIINLNSDYELIFEKI